jgi:hypothetical protein
LTQNWTQQVALSGEKYVVTFSISIPYLVCAIISSLLAVVAIAPLYWNLWKERFIPLPFNPLNVARVFAAPIMQDADCKETIEDYMRKANGLRRVTYLASGSDDAVGMLSTEMRSENA